MGRVVKGRSASLSLALKVKRQEAAQIRKWTTSKSYKRSTPTKFQQRVYDCISKIPAGKVASYGEIARKLESSARAVGNALRNNPFAPVVPCHRVVASNR